MGETAKLSIDPEILEKSYSDAKDALDSFLNGEDTLFKAKGEGKKKEAKADSEDFDDLPDEMDFEDDDDEGDKKKDVKKSLETSISENAEAEAAMDVEPFLRQLVKGIDAKFLEMETSIKGLQKGINGVGELQKAVAKMVSVGAELSKSVRDTVEQIGDSPVQSGSVLKKGGDKFSRFNENTVPVLDKEAVMQKALKLSREGKFSALDITKIEGRLNKGMELEAHHMSLLQEGK
jgi:hypothetical protein